MVSHFCEGVGIPAKVWAPKLSRVTLVTLQSACPAREIFSTILCKLMLAPVWHLAHDWVARWQHVECRVEISRSFFRGLLPQQKCRGAVCCEHLPSSRLTIELPARTTHAQNQYRIMWQHLSNSHAEKSGSFVAEYHNSSYGQPANIFVSITCSCTQNSVVENQTRHEGSCLRLINATGSRWFLPKWHLCSESIT